MEIEKNKFFAKKSFARSIFLLMVCTPLLFGALLKLFYFMPKSSGQLSDAFSKVVHDFVSKLYYGFEPIQYLWPISPTPSVEDVLTTGNFLALLVFLGFLWGIASFQVGVETIDELSQAKKNARKKRLEDEYRDRW